MATLKDIASGIEKLQKFTRDVENVEYKEQILDLREMIADVREELLEKDDELKTARDEIAALKETAEFAESLIAVDGYKYDSVDEKPVGLPYCPTCEVRDGKLFRLIRFDENRSRCHNCKQSHPAGKDGRVHAKKNSADFAKIGRQIG